jgi:S-adenosylmethionine decarboxylase
MQPTMHGLHLTADLRGCPADQPAMTDPDTLRTACLQAVRAVGLTPVGELFHRFPAPPDGPAGLTGVVLLAESHLAIHTWPERGEVTLDVYVCHLGADNRQRADALLARLLPLFDAAHADLHRLERGRAIPAQA